MKFREMIQSDIDFVANNSISRGMFSKQPEVIDYSYCLEHEGNILAIGGIRLITPTVAWLWIDLTHYAASHTLTVYRVLKEYLDIVTKNNGIKRGQAYVEADFEEAIRLVAHLGFHRESTMEKFVNEKPAYLYVKFFGTSNDTCDKLE